MKVALIGPGRMGVNYAKVIEQHPSVELVAICGNSKENTTKNASSFNKPLYFDNQWKLMFEQHPEIDTVIISTSEWAHVDPFIDSVKAGKNIIIEKPLTISLAEAKKMERALNESKVKVAVCYTSRFDVRFQQAYNLLQQKPIGKIGYIYSRRNADVNAANRVMGKIPMAYWLTPHDIDLMRWFTGSEVVEVAAFQDKNSATNNYLHVNLSFKNGTRGVIEISWFGKKLSGQHHSQFDVEGENGRIEVNMSDPVVIHLSPGGDSETPDLFDFVNMCGNYHGATSTMINHFVDAIQGKSQALVGFNDGMRAIEVCHAIESSIQQGKTLVI